MNKGIFITGTNTGVGKTLVSTLLMLAARDERLNARYFKPIQTGSDLDTETVRKLANLSDDSLIEPVYSLQLPAAPYRAALAENKIIDLNAVVDRFKQFSNTYCVVEGAGGILVPLTPTLLIRDMIQMLNLPVVIVASTQLGTINHTLLTIEVAQSKKIPISGIILLGPADPGLSDTLQKFSQIPILAEIPWLEKISPPILKKIASAAVFKNLILRK